MLAALINSSAPCTGPRVARRHFTNARVSGGTDKDIVKIGNVVIAGNGDLPIQTEGDMIQVEHQSASGQPINVILV